MTGALTVPVMAPPENVVHVAVAPEPVEVEATSLDAVDGDDAPMLSVPPDVRRIRSSIPAPEDVCHMNLPNVVVVEFASSSPPNKATRLSAKLVFLAAQVIIPRYGDV